MSASIKHIRRGVATSIRETINRKITVMEWEPFVVPNKVVVSMFSFGFNRDLRGMAQDINLAVLVQIPVKDKAMTAQDISDELLDSIDEALTEDPTFGGTCSHSILDGVDVTVEGAESPIILQKWRMTVQIWETGLGR